MNERPSPCSSTETALINVYSVTFRGASNYSTRPVIVREHVIDASSQGRHSIWPQLIAADGLAGSDRTMDSPVVLRWTEVDGDTIRENAQPRPSCWRTRPGSPSDAPTP